MHYILTHCIGNALPTFHFDFDVKMELGRIIKSNSTCTCWQIIEKDSKLLNKRALSFEKDFEYINSIEL
jgi:hypothetical protein